MMTDLGRTTVVEGASIVPTMPSARRFFGGRPHVLSFVAGMAAGVAGMLVVASARALTPIQPVAVTLHRFDLRPGSEATFGQWIAFLHARHREAVATLGRERTYFEAMFTAADEPRRLYWLTVEGAGGATVESSDLDLDRRHKAYMDTVLVRGSHVRLSTRNVLTPDFITRAVHDHQARDER